MRARTFLRLLAIGVVCASWSVYGGTIAYGQAAEGSASGTSSRFGIVSPSEVAARGEMALQIPIEWQPPEHEIPPQPDPENPVRPLAPFRANEVEDRWVWGEDRVSGLIPALAQPQIAFPGISATNRVPPDPVIAVGPSHVLAAVNSEWAIFTKGGTKLFQTSAATWFQDQLPGLGQPPLGLPYDPQLAYDSFAGRWILLYLATDKKTQSWLLLSVSSSSDPNGTWVNYTFKGDVNGSTHVENWSDFPALGFDNTAIYVALNQYTYSTTTTFVYSKLRILKKDPLYGGDTASFFDFWGLADPDFPTVTASSLRPAETFGTPGVEYIVSNCPFVSKTYVTLWTVANAGSTSPTLTKVNVPVTATTAPPDANQLGGSPGTPMCATPCLIDTGGGRITSAVYRNGSVWFSHAVAGGTGGGYSRARYARIDVGSRGVLEDQSLGNDTCWYFYPAVQVDSADNLIMVFGRTCVDQYAGIRFSGRSVEDSFLQASTPVRAGESSYVVPVGTTDQRNRWGDYFRAALDPSDSAKIWMIGEYAASPANTWGTYIAQGSVTCSAPAIPTAGNNGPVSEGHTLQLTATSSPGATYFWSGPNGFQATEQNPSIPNVTVAASGTYFVSASLGACTSLTGTTVVNVSPAGGCRRCTRILPPRPVGLPRG